MNFYKHHLGDYAAATAHLSWDEDCAYRRLLDQYYKREAPIPADLKEACRLTRAQSPAQRRAVETVLREFFTLADDGWHQKRCDEELGSASAQAETNRRIAADREARKRERMQHEPSHESLNASANEPSTNRSPATSGEREPSQTPDSRLQTPDSKKPEKPKAGEPPFVPPDWISSESWSAWLAVRKTKKAASTAYALRLAVGKLEKWRDAGHDPQAIVDSSVVAGWSDLYEPKPAGSAGGSATRDDWWASDAGITRKANELGVSDRNCRTFAELREKVNAKLREAPRVA